MKFIIGTKNGKRYEANQFSMVDNEDEKTVTLFNRCYEIDSEGKSITGEGIANWTRKLIADNSTKVDPVTGAYYEPDENGAYPQNAIGEYDFFRYISANVPVVIDDFKLAVLSKNRKRLMPNQEEPDPE